MSRVVVRTDEVPQRPYLSQAVKVTAPAEIVYTAGWTAVGLDGALIGEGNFDLQVRTIFRHLERILNAAGATLADVTKLTNYFTDLRYLPQYNALRVEIFGPEPPSSSSVQVVALAIPGALIEIEAVAVISLSEVAGGSALRSEVNSGIRFALVPGLARARRFETSPWDSRVPATRRMHRSALRLQAFPDSVRRERKVDVGDAERSEGVDDGIEDG
jgi:enamine deaminase RidA (YjgF/YER057c/UK114 family)